MGAARKEKRKRWELQQACAKGRTHMQTQSLRLSITMAVAVAVALAVAARRTTTLSRHAAGRASSMAPSMAMLRMNRIHPNLNNQPCDQSRGERGAYHMFSKKPAIG